MEFDKFAGMIIKPVVINNERKFFYEAFENAIGKSFQTRKYFLMWR